MVDVIAEPLSIIFERQMGEVSEDWEIGTATSVFGKGKKKDPGNYRSVTLTFVPGKVMEKFVLDTVARSGQYGFTKEKSCLISLLIYNYKLL